MPIDLYTTWDFKPGDFKESFLKTVSPMVYFIHGMLWLEVCDWLFYGHFPYKLLHASWLKVGTVLEWVLFIISLLLQYGEKSMDSEGSMVHYINFQVNKQQRSGLVFAIINSAHSKIVPILSREAVLLKKHRL